MPAISWVGPKKPLTLQQKTVTPDAEGNTTFGPWNTVTQLFGTINQLSAQEMLLAEQRTERVTHAIVIRYRSGLPPPRDLRFIYSGRYFEVKSITDPDESHRFLNCQCEEIVTTQTSAT